MAPKRSQITPNEPTSARDPESSAIESEQSGQPRRKGSWAGETPQSRFFPSTNPTRPQHALHGHSNTPQSSSRSSASSANQPWTSWSGLPFDYNSAAPTISGAYTTYSGHPQSLRQDEYRFSSEQIHPSYTQDCSVPGPSSVPLRQGPFTPREDATLPATAPRSYSVSSVQTGPQASSVPAQVPPQPRQRASGKDEFDGPHQFLPKPENAHLEVTEDQLISLVISLRLEEQAEILDQVEDCLSQCAFGFIARYQFPVPLEADKRPVRAPSDRAWTEWCHLLKRLTTKRRIPTRVLWHGQIKQLITVLDNSIETRHPVRAQERLPRDDRNILQLVSAALQVAKMLKDPQAMLFLDGLYSRTEHVIRERTVGFHSR